MKGLSLPINIVVIIAIAILVLLAIAAFFATGFGGGVGSISDGQALQEGCGLWKSNRCVALEGEGFVIQGYDPDADGESDALSDACSRVLGSPDLGVGSPCFNYCCAEKSP